ncbi:MAG: glycine cleavage system protein GcvH [Lachnospiraceae bacterium]|nr:glycine cleavage system protein GcvH [Lachnospiraceae bacterium]MBO4461564.1 glycine cleavage system protein GcvH [Lachnospiraceae bacterium]MBR5788631.1 glycine cleavage system protein GcvH [Lachnospiraceae bacterium]
MNTPAELKYTKTHEWVKIEGNTATIGLTDFAQSELGDLVFVNLPEEGDAVTAGDVFADVESVKAVSDVNCPVTGEVAEINEEILDEPAKINEAPYEAWFIKVNNVTDTEDLMTADEYDKFCESEK